jgi:EamA domain-containing membrane protein RarD
VLAPFAWFALVWVALVIFTFDGVRRHRRRQLRLTAEACAI